MSSLPPVGTTLDLPALDSTMRVVELGRGDPVLFLHGNPTSSFLWRDVLPTVAASGYRCLAVDLIGMGASGKPDIAYRFADHADYLDALLDAVDLEVPPVLVGHDWGAVLALHRARRLPGRVRAVALCEAHIHPVEAWADLGDGAGMFQRLRAPGTGETLVLEENFFVEEVLPAGMVRTPTSAEMDAYRAPYPDRASRLPVLVWAREIPIEGSPAQMVDVVTANQGVITDPAVPTLLMHGDPGAIVGAADVAWCREHGGSLTIADVGPGLHFLPEDRPEQIAAALVGWLGDLTAPGPC